MPHILFLARSFPPAGFIAAVRAKNIVKHLSQLGWRVSVVVPDPKITVFDEAQTNGSVDYLNCKVSMIYTKYWAKFMLPGFFKNKDKRETYSSKICRQFAQLMFIDNGVGWIFPALRSCRHFKPGDVDIVMATGAPYSSFVIAAILANRLNCPYVLDYRDPWTVGPHHKRSFPAIYKKLERYLVQGAKGLTVVSSSLAEAIKHELRIDRDLKVITNGYDPDESEYIQKTKFGHPAIVYAGRFYPPKRVITPLIRAMSLVKQKIIASESMPRLHYFGDDKEHVVSEAKKFSVEQYVNCHGRVPRETAMSATKGAMLAVVITSVQKHSDIWDRGIVTGKLFEPMNLGTPILLIAPPKSDVVSIIERSNAGRAFHGDDVESMAAYIAEMCNSSTKEAKSLVNEYAWPNIIKKLDQCLSSCIVG